MEIDDELIDEAPPWSGAALAVFAKGAKTKVFDEETTITTQSKPLIGKDGLWVAEAYIDTGSKTARGLKGVEEGFVLKTSILIRYWNGKQLVERILYPYSKGAPSFLLLQGDDRKRQASLYVAELAMVLALLQDTPRLPDNMKTILEGPRLIVRHGSLLQSLGTYFNKIFDLDEDTAESLLLYVGLDKPEARELIEKSIVKRKGGLVRKVNPGLLAAAILAEIKEKINKTEHIVLGLTEDVSRGRHLIAVVLAELIKASIDSVRQAFSPETLIDLALAKDRDARSCLSDLYPGSIDSFRRASEEWFTDLAKILVGEAGETDRYQLYEELSNMNLNDIIDRIYERQILNLVGLVSDSHFLLLYNYLFGNKQRYPVSREVNKSWLYQRRIASSYEIRIMGDDTTPYTKTLSINEVDKATSDVALRYVFTERVPSCSEIEEISGRLNMDRRLVAELIRVIPPIRIEYFKPKKKEAQRLQEAMGHVLTQALVTQYGVPPQLLVVDSRSRINEWEFEALSSMLEALSRRTMPYSTFIREFAVRRRYIL